MVVLPWYWYWAALGEPWAKPGPAKIARGTSSAAVTAVAAAILMRFMAVVANLSELERRPAQLETHDRARTCARQLASRAMPWWESGVVYQIYPRSFAD